MSGPDRVQTGVRLEMRLVKVLKALAELYDLSLGELLEDLVRDAFRGPQAVRGRGPGTDRRPDADLRV
jgi:hypothetical protein